MSGLDRPSSLLAPIREALSKKQAIILVGNCKVEYSGRASSLLDYGERIIIIKADRAVLIHRPIGYEPVNWQPPGSIITADLTETGELKLTCRRTHPREVLAIYVKEGKLSFRGHLADSGRFSMYVTEEQMKQAIILRPSLLGEELRVSSEEYKVTGVGFTDLLAYDSQGRLVVIEVKRNPVDRAGVLQLAKYVEELNRETGKPVRGILAAPSLRKGIQALVKHLGLHFRQLKPEDCLNVTKEGEAKKIVNFM